MDTTSTPSFPSGTAEFTRSPTPNGSGSLQTVNVQVPSMQDLLGLYLKSLSEKEFKAYEIAKSHLGSTFDLEKSIGFLQWKALYLQVKN